MEYKDTSLKKISGTGSYVIRNQSGLTLVEIMTVVVIIALLALFAAPEIISWRPRMHLKSASDELFANTQRAKIHAIKNNIDVVFSFTVGTCVPGDLGSYQFDEVPATIPPLIAVNMADEVCLSASTFAAGEGFTSRGLPINSTGGKVTITSTKIATQFEVEQSIAGGVTLDKL